MGADSYADVVERLFEEFEQTLPLPAIARMVGQCRQHWSGSGQLDALEHEARRELTTLSLSACPDPPTIPAQRGSRGVAAGSRSPGSVRAHLDRAGTCSASVH
jgi:hypothetical protein